MNRMRSEHTVRQRRLLSVQVITDELVDELGQDARMCMCSIISAVFLFNTSAPSRMCISDGQRHRRNPTTSYCSAANMLVAVLPNAGDPRLTGQGAVVLPYPIPYTECVIRFRVWKSSWAILTIRFIFDGCTKRVAC